MLLISGNLLSEAIRASCWCGHWTLSRTGSARGKRKQKMLSMNATWWDFGHIQQKFWPRKSVDISELWVNGWVTRRRYSWRQTREPEKKREDLWQNSWREWMLLFSSSCFHHFFFLIASRQRQSRQIARKKLARPTCAWLSVVTCEIYVKTLSQRS